MNLVYFLNSYAIIFFIVVSLGSFFFYLTDKSENKADKVLSLIQYISLVAGLVALVKALSNLSDLHKFAILISFAILSNLYAAILNVFARIYIRIKKKKHY